MVAKNYLTEHEMVQLSRLVNAYLDVAEDMAQRKIPMTMQDWEVEWTISSCTDRRSCTSFAVSDLSWVTTVMAHE